MLSSFFLFQSRETGQETGATGETEPVYRLPMIVQTFRENIMKGGSKEAAERVFDGSGRSFQASRSETAPIAEQRFDWL